jgi:Zn-finger nucleic acid-binding protein
MGLLDLAYDAITLVSTRTRIMPRAGETNVGRKGITMKCPNCSTEMVARDSRGVQLDECPSCRGLWFEAGELLTYFHLRGAPGEQSHSDLFAGFKKQELPFDEFCPRCEGKRLHFGVTQELSISICNSCQGVFVGGRQVSALEKSASKSLLELLLLQVIAESPWFVFK